MQAKLSAGAIEINVKLKILYFYIFYTEHKSLTRYIGFNTTSSFADFNFFLGKVNMLVSQRHDIVLEFSIVVKHYSIVRLLQW